jgi:hypothetical protein
MRAARRTVSRRAFLGAAAAAGPLVAISGCRDGRLARPDPDAAALAAARDTERRLVEAYDGARRAEHLAHLTALGGTAPTAPVAPAVADPAGLVRASVSSLQTAAIGAHSGQVAAVLASIAAAHLAVQGRT